MLTSERRSALFGPKVRDKISWPPRRALEFGAGAALPSLVLFREGAEQIICTDRKVNEQTFDALHMSFEKNCLLWGMSEDEKNRRVRIMPHTWGEEIEKLTERNGGSGGDNMIDLLVASDCIYNPMYHQALLESAAGSINKETGIFIVGYSFHMNVPPGQVLDFFDTAETQFGFQVLSALTKQYDGQMGIGSNDPTRGAVYMKVLAHKDSIFWR